jgi:hypothetical protein
VCTLLQHAGRELGAAIHSCRRVTAVHAYEDTVCCTSTTTSSTAGNSVAAVLTAAATAVASCILSVCSSMSLWYIEPSSGSMWVVTDNSNSNDDSNAHGNSTSNDSSNSSTTGKSYLSYLAHALCAAQLQLLCVLC